MAASDKLVGAGALLVAVIVFVYYTLWALILPFFPPEHPIHNHFPPREWAVRIPAFLLVVGLSAVGAFIGSVLIKEGRKRREKNAVKQA
ncbi:uncharacterized protein EI90DRAFT_2970777 [Cantharellus anzutake]|uniref:uncharacterized protein n=1 Tax=Cantharellus anzutake TaxID=1750568 RepID=UPI0019044F4C|nr:uncharacterized protein EI90DRAFT_2970777 [Cantharellus anzutake]KAF8334323.1 hypothetical protein EI90DRAFT_2970777 [Cantharellus anzutake]